MTAETPERIPVTVPTPDNVAEMLTGIDGDYHDGNEWHPGLSADGNVVRIKIEPYGAGGEKLPVQHFEAHVFTVDPPAPVAAEPVRLDLELARELAYNGPGTVMDGWTVVADVPGEARRWVRGHQLVIRNEQGEHFAGDYDEGLTEEQEATPWEYEKSAPFYQVVRQVRVVQSVEWVKPGGEI